MRGEVHDVLTGDYSVTILREVLTDGSCVFNVQTSGHEFACRDERHARKLAAALSDCLDMQFNPD